MKAWRRSLAYDDGPIYAMTHLFVSYEESGNPSWSQVNTIGSILISTCILGEENEEDEYERSRKREGQIIWIYLYYGNMMMRTNAQHVREYEESSAEPSESSSAERRRQSRQSRRRQSRQSRRLA